MLRNAIDTTKKLRYNKEDVLDFICREDHLDSSCTTDMVVKEGWCRYECRTDLEDFWGMLGGYVVYDKKVPHAFPVWIVREEVWY